MKGVKQGLAKVLLKLSITVISINFGFNAVLFPVTMSFYTPTIRAYPSAVSKYKKKVPKDFKAIDYLNLSNMIVNTQGEGYGVCRDYATETLRVYKQLVKENEREDLEDKIRLVCGTYGYTFKEKGHMWMEVAKDGEWMRYESTGYTPKMELEEIPAYSETSLKWKQDLSGDDEKIVEVMKTFNGTQIYYPTKNIVLNGGVAEMIYYGITDPD